MRLHFVVNSILSQNLMYLHVCIKPPLPNKLSTNIFNVRSGVLELMYGNLIKT